MPDADYKYWSNGGSVEDTEGVEDTERGDGASEFYDMPGPESYSQLT